ncbi:hypothetical protein [Flavobacterium sedimenticola]|uniref:Glycerophosphoryl diester phosphodiesterase membrane domain-containing protein n=1 Tax=Flavobacterium sedimenticola TaxID=3043286 RepID=A0ABT6XT16_9FLAO|nr:hypothetical protein [Flavobacterium sedimenticola]MDI9258250.1 hypothetical protein [Flavobacterium sedimenticola]
MFTLFKRRDFGDYVSDTFGFFRQTGKHYLKNYFTISGPLLLIMVVLSYFLFQVYFDFVLRFDRNGMDNSQYLENYLSNNFLVVVAVALFFFLFLVFMSMLSYAIPVIYFDLYDKHNGNSFSSKEILQQFKSRFGKILIFFLGTLFIITPLLILVFVVLILLCFILIGIPLLLFAIPTAFSWITLSFFEYLNTDKGLFSAYGQGFRSILSQYFPIVGSTMVIYIIIQITMSVFTMIPYMFGIVSMVSSTQNMEADGDAFSTFRIMMTIVMVISILMSYIMNNILMINQGLVYYSRIEHNENKSADHSIDLIGSE